MTHLKFSHSEGFMLLLLLLMVFKIYMIYFIVFFPLPQLLPAPLHLTPYLNAWFSFFLSQREMKKQINK